VPKQKHEFLFPNGDRKWMTVEDGAKTDKPEGTLLIIITATLFKELHDKAERLGTVTEVDSASKN
jgi:hypothetical protein